MLRHRAAWLIMPNGDAIQATGITKGFGRTAILRGVTLSVQRGEAIAIVGPSGSGKSTLMAILGLLTTADDGELSLFGDRVEPGARGLLGARARRAVAWIPQAPLVLPARTVLENALLPHLFRRVAPTLPERVDSLLELTGLGALRDRRASVLSGGELQRLAVVRALGAGASLVLADEPTASLDAANSAAVIRSLIEHRGDATVVIATHDLRVAAACTRRLVLDDGTIEAAP